METMPAKQQQSLSRQLSEFACALRWEHLSPASVGAAKRFWLDSLGCALGGLKSHDAKIAHRVYRKFGGKPEATVIGTDWKTGARDAAFLNNLMIRIMDYNDIYWEQDPSHPSDMLGMVLSLVEQKKLSGKDLIVATVLAYEIEMRLCEAAFPGIREVGWHHATLTQFVSPLVAGKLYGLTPEQMTHAVGIAGCRQGTFGGVVAGKLSMMKNTADPMAGASGVESALLAAQGYTGPEEIFEGKEGLFHCIGAQTGVHWKPEILTDGLSGLLKRRRKSRGAAGKQGAEFRILRCGMKAFPTEALTHSPISCALDLVEDGGYAPEEIEQVTVKTTARAKDILSDPSKYTPSSKETADHSLPYTVAVALLDGSVTTASFEEKRLRDPKLPPVMKKVEVLADRGIDAAFPEYKRSEVILKLKDRAPRSASVDYPKGDPRNPMTEEEITVKFRALAGRSLSRKKQDRVIELVNELDKLDRVTRLINALRAGK
jgi:2-methylcitrate dehydratase